jgi:hypothetical protein
VKDLARIATVFMTQITPLPKKMAQAKGLRHVFFTLYIQNIKSKGAIWTFFRNYYFHPNQQLRAKCSSFRVLTGFSEMHQ